MWGGFGTQTSGVYTDSELGILSSVSTPSNPPDLWADLELLVPHAHLYTIKGLVRDADRRS